MRLSYKSGGGTRDGFLKSWMEESAPVFWNRWGGASPIKMPKYLAVNGRKKHKYLVLKCPKPILGAMGMKKLFIFLYFHFSLHLYAQFGSKIHFLSEKTPNFSKKAPSAPKFWALRVQNFVGQPQSIGGRNLLFLGSGRAAPSTHRPRKTRPWAVPKRI